MENTAETRHGATLDPMDARRFEALAGEWWDERGKFSALHALNPVRLAFIIEEAKRAGLARNDGFRALDGVSVLDVGCGGGILSEPLARLGARVTGIDPVEQSIEVARAHASAQGLEIAYRAALAEDLAAEGAVFDLVVASEVIKHVADVDAFLRTCRSLTKPSGLLIISTLNRTAKSYALAIIGAEYVLGLIPRGTHDWRKFIKPEELDGQLQTAQFSTLRRQGILYNPLGATFTLSDRDVSVNYIQSAKAI
jgi:2-polyprenyl-6-hydroxyphenyl methylase/3-demethylubiquinone-9 3-methyltransferase